MIKKVEITGIHTDIEADIKKYVTKKIAKLDEYMPKHARKSTHADVKLQETVSKTRKQSTCEVLLYVPNEIIQAKETTLNMYAAIDIVEEKLKAQLKKYKDQTKPATKHSGARIHRAFGKIVGK